MKPQAEKRSRGRVVVIGAPRWLTASVPMMVGLVLTLFVASQFGTPGGIAWCVGWLSLIAWAES